MSRYYRINVRAINTDIEELSKVMECEFNWDNTCDPWDEKETINYLDCNKDRIVSCYEGEGKLCGGQSEEECYNQIKDYYLSINPNVKVEVTLTCLEDIPCETYGGLE